MKYTFFVLLCLLFTLPLSDEAVGVSPYERYDHQAIENVFRVLSKKERSHVYDLLGAYHAFAYYDTLDDFSHADEVAHLRMRADDDIRKLKQSATYQSVLYRIGRNNKRHLSRYIAHWSQAGRQYAHARNNIADKDELSPKDIFYFSKEQKRYSVAKVGKIFFVVLLSLVAVMAIIVLIGIRCFPQIPLFKKAQFFLEI